MQPDKREETVLSEANRLMSSSESGTLEEGMLKNILDNLKDRAEYAVKSNLSYGDHDILLNVYKFIADKKYEDAAKLWMRKFKVGAETAAKAVLKLARHQEDVLRGAFNKRA